ncbi:MAG: hypothetical protein QOD99_2311 [Chthoniobacter sp.]|jgi:nucleotide-binding universal stress UspA family protein|nr:hypothetical protein [Chthoniobacter sp.]
MKVLICSDGHARAENAIRFLASTLAACAADVTVLGIIEHPADEASLAEALRKQVQILRDKHVAVEIVTRTGQPIEEIKKRTTEQAFDFVVIGAERKNGGHFAMAAKVYHIVKTIDPPVLAVTGNRSELRRILLCSGGRTYIDRAIKLTGLLAAKSQLAVTILHVLAEPPALYSDLIAREEDAAKLLASNSALGRNLRSEKEALEALGVRPVIKLRHGMVATEILNELEHGLYDLIVTGSALAAGPVRSYIMGDVTSEILNRADCPVFVVRGGEPPPGFFASIARLFGKTRTRS